MEEGKLMVKALTLVLVMIGLAAGGFWFANPEVATKTFDEMTVNAAKAVTDIQEKFNSK